MIIVEFLHCGYPYRIICFLFCSFNTISPLKMKLFDEIKPKINGSSVKYVYLNSNIIRTVQIRVRPYWSLQVISLWIGERRPKDPAKNLVCINIEERLVILESPERWRFFPSFQKLKFRVIFSISDKMLDGKCQCLLCLVSCFRP